MRYFALFFLLISNSFALAPDPNVLILALIAGVISLLFVAIMFMLANFLQDPSLEAHAKENLKEIFIGAITVLVVYIALVGSDLLFILTGQTYQQIETYVTQKLDSYINALKADFESTIRVGHRVTMVTSYFFSKSAGFIFFFGSSQSPYAGLSGLRSSLYRLANDIITGILIYETLKMLLTFFGSFSWYIFAFGFMLRMFPFSKKLGGILIALGISVSILFPYSLYISTLMHDKILEEARAKQILIHSQITAADLDRISLRLPNLLEKICTNEWIRWFTSLNEWGWWLILCPPFCLGYATFICTISCTGATIGFAACFAACFPKEFLSCIMPIKGLCWQWISYPFFTTVTSAFSMFISIALVSAGKRLESSLGDPSQIYSIVMSKLIIPGNIAAVLPIMELVLVLAFVIVGARALSSVLGGELFIAGLGRLV